MDKYLILIEKAVNNYSAFSPDVIGCAATGNTIEEAVSNFRDAIASHLELCYLETQNIPLPMGMEYHIANDFFNKENIATEYFIREIKVPIVQSV